MKLDSRSKRPQLLQARLSKSRLVRLVEEATVDCYNESDHIAQGSNFKPCGFSIALKNRRATRRALRYVLNARAFTFS